MNTKIDMLACPLLEAEQYTCSRNGLPNTIGHITQCLPMRVGFFGTSVTNGIWPKIFINLMQRRFSTLSIEPIYSSIGGSDSQLGSYRLKHDLLVHKPDLVFVEFVNDWVRTDRQMVAMDMDAIIEQLQTILPNTDVVLVYVPHFEALKIYDQAQLPAHIHEHEQVARRRGIPSIDLAVLLYKLIGTGEMKWQDYADNMVHPDLPGHTLLAKAIDHAMSWIMQQQIGMHKGAVEPLDTNALSSDLIPIQRSMFQVADPHKAITNWKSMLQTGVLTREFPERHQYYNDYLQSHMPSVGWLDTPGDRLIAEFQASTIGIYDLHGPDTGTIEAHIDGQSIGCFDRYIPAGKAIYRLSTGLIFARFETSKMHQIQITLTDKRPPTGLPPIFLPGFWMTRG